MKAPFVSSITAASLLADNVIPSIRSVVSGSAASEVGLGAYDLSLIDLLAAAAGFNCLVQCSNELCLRVFTASWAPSELDVDIDPRQLQSFLNSQISLTSSYLAGLKASFPRSFPVLPRITINFEPQSLHFTDANHVQVTGQGSAWLFGPAVSVFNVPNHTAYNPSASPQSSQPSPAPSPTGLYSSSSIGSFNFTLTLRFSAVPDAPNARAYVWCDAGTAQVALGMQDNTDISLLLNAGFLGQDGSLVTTHLAPSANIQLTPTVSLFGQEAPRGNSDYAAFSVSAWALVPRADLLAVGFNVTPATQGSAADVEPFLFGQDYGLISDELVVEHLLKHKWNDGGFARTLQLVVSQQAQNNGSVENATVTGYLELDTLDFVSMETDPTTRKDVIVMGGGATFTAQSVLLSDGEALSQVQLSALTNPNMSWGVEMLLAPTLVLSGPADRQLFEQQAYNDACCYIGRPFANVPSPAAVQLAYVRLDSVAKQVAVMANVVNLFT